MMDEPATLFAQAKTLHKAGRLAEAIALYARAAELKPDYAEAHNNLGNALGEARRFEEAVGSLQRAAVLRPELAAIHSNLGLALARSWTRLLGGTLTLATQKSGACFRLELPG